MQRPAPRLCRRCKQGSGLEGPAGADVFRHQELSRSGAFPKVLNVAGPRASHASEMPDRARAFLREVLGEVDGSLG
jgi:hypothetical protein